MKRKLFDVINELDDRIIEFNKLLESEMKELQDLLQDAYNHEDYMRPSGAIVSAEAIERQIASLQFHVRRYLALTATDVDREER